MLLFQTKTLLENFAMKQTEIDSNWDKQKIIENRDDPEIGVNID